MAQVNEIEQDFKRLIKNEALGHAYALYGPHLPSQFMLAKSLANFLEQKKWQEPQGLLLDAKCIDGTTQDLGVEVARSFADFLYRQPVASLRRTLVINNAVEFTTQAQNAILKIVEEPPKHALIILTLRDINSLVPPLKSRLQTIYVAPDRGASSPTRTALEERAHELVDKFMMSAPAARSALIKELIAADKEDDVEKSEKIVDTFVSCLIAELAKKPELYTAALKEALKRQTAMNDFTTSKKLQIEAIAQFLK